MFLNGFAFDCVKIVRRRAFHEKVKTETLAIFASGKENNGFKFDNMALHRASVRRTLGHEYVHIKFKCKLEETSAMPCIHLFARYYVISKPSRKLV